MISLPQGEQKLKKKLYSHKSTQNYRWKNHNQEPVLGLGIRATAHKQIRL